MGNIDYYKEEIYKTAANKARRLYDAGEISLEAGKKLFLKPSEYNPVKKGISNIFDKRRIGETFDNFTKSFKNSEISQFRNKSYSNTNINNKINARAKRLEGGVMPKVMNSDSYKRVSVANNIPDRAPLDTHRIMKQQGHENEKVISQIRRNVGKEKVNIKFHENPNELYGSSAYGADTLYKVITQHDIILPNNKARAKIDPVQNKFNKEMITKPYNPIADKEYRALIARHEISGESISQHNMLKAMKANDINVDHKTINLFNLASHNNPGVLIGDAAMAKRLSPDGRQISSVSNDFNLTRFKNNGKPLSENQMMNFFNEVDSDKLDQPYFMKKMPDKNKQEKILKRLGRRNLGFHEDAPSSILDELVESYLNAKFLDR